MSEGLLFYGNKSTILLFYSIFRTTPEVSRKFTLLKYVKSQRSYGFLITKELMFGFQILDLKDHFSASLNNFINPRSILKQLCMRLVEVVNANRQLSVSKKFCFKYRISMIKAELSFFLTSNSESHGSHGNKGTILVLGSVNFPMSIISTKLYFSELCALC